MDSKRKKLSSNNKPLASSTPTLPPIPPEVWYEIFLYTPPKDLLNLKKTSRAFREIASDNDFWRSKFRETFPKIYKKMVNKPDIKWEKEFWYAYRIRQYFPRSYKNLLKKETFDLEKFFLNRFKKLPEGIQAVVLHVNENNVEAIRELNFSTKDLAKLDNVPLNVSLNVSPLLFRLGYLDDYSQEVKDFIFKKIMNDYLNENVKSNADTVILTKDEKSKEMVRTKAKNRATNLHKTDPHKKDALGISLFDYAILFNQLADVNTLIENKANINRRNAYVLGKEKKLLPLLMASKYGYTGIVETLLAHRVNVNETDDNGQIALHAAAANGRVTIIRSLIKKGAFIDAIDQNNNTPLHLAIRFGKPKTIKYLLEKKAQMNIPNKNGNTPLHLAAQLTNAKIVKILLNERSKTLKRDPKRNLFNINAANDDGKTPLHLAAEKDNTIIIKLLLESGAQIDPVTQSGETPLSLAASRGNINAVKLLLNNNATNNFNIDLALQAAVTGGHIPTALVLINAANKLNDQRTTSDDIIKNDQRTISDDIIKSAKPLLQPLLKALNYSAEMKKHLSGDYQQPTSSTTPSFSLFGFIYPAKTPAQETLPVQDNLMAVQELIRVMLGKADESILEEYKEVQFNKNTALGKIYREWLKLKTSLEILQQNISEIKPQINEHDQTIDLFFPTHAAAKLFKLRLHRLGPNKNIHIKDDQYFISFSLEELLPIIGNDQFDNLIKNASPSYRK